MAVWNSFFRFFRKDYRVTVFDFPGQGGGKIVSGPPEVDLGEQIEVVRAVQEHASPPGKVYLFGSSWGGVVAAAFAAKYPSRVEKALLASFGTKPSSRMTRVINQGQELYRNGVGAKIGHLLVDEFGQLIPETLKSRIVNQFTNMKEEHFQNFLAHSESVKQIRHIHEIIDLGKIQAETLIMNGAKDALLDSQDIEEVATAIDNCRFEVIPDAGHFLHFEDPRILDQYADFFAGV